MGIGGIIYNNQNKIISGIIEENLVNNKDLSKWKL